MIFHPINTTIIAMRNISQRGMWNITIKDGIEILINFYRYYFVFSFYKTTVLIFVGFYP